MKIIEQLEKIGKELYHKCGTDSYVARCMIHDLKEAIKSNKTDQLPSEIKKERDELLIYLNKSINILDKIRKFIALKDEDILIINDSKQLINKIENK